MKKIYRKISAVLWGIEVLSILALCVNRTAFILSANTIYILLWLLSLSAMCIIFTFLPLCRQENFTKCNNLLHILYDNNNPDLYIAENMKLLESNRSATTKALLHINICVGYCEKGDYEEAKSQLRPIKLRMLHGFCRAAYLVNCAYVSFYLGETAEALSYMKQNRRGLRKLQNYPNYVDLVTILHIFELLAIDNPEEARRLYRASPGRFMDGRTKDDFESLKQMLAESN